MIRLIYNYIFDFLSSLWLWIYPSSPMRAVGGYILISPTKEGSTKNKSGVYMSDAHKDAIRYREAKIDMVSNAVKGVKEGDSIYYDRHAGHDMEIKGVMYKVITIGDIVVVL